VKKITLSYLSLAAATLLVVLAPLNARAAAGDLYEADFGSGSVFKFTPAGVKSTSLQAWSTLPESLSIRMGTFLWPTLARVEF
jgi:hypothetical protein